jgi:cell division inhibitor SepF
MSFFKKTMSYLGLGPDEVYDEYDDYEEERPQRRGSYAPEHESATVRTIPAGRAPAQPQGRGVPAEEMPAVAIRPRAQGSTVRTVAASPAQAKPHTLRPRRFDQAQEIADSFKEGSPVIVNLQDVSADLSRRLIDFASGLCYGLGGSMEKVASGVYLLTPANVSVSPEDRRAIATDHDD